MARIVDKEAKRASITEAAVEVFARKGFQGTSMDDVAEQAGVSKGSLYAYFQNKEDLFYATFEWFNQRTMAEGMAALQAAPTACEKLRALGRVTVESLANNLDLYPLTLEVWAAAGSGEGRERFAGAMRHLYDEFRRLVEMIIRVGQGSGEFRADLEVPALSALLVGALDGLMLQCWLKPDLPAMNYFDSYLDVLFRGMQPPFQPGGKA